VKQYLLSVYQPDVDEAPPAEFLEPIIRDLEVVNAEIRAAGAWVFSAGLDFSGAATVVRLKGDEVLTTDGPYIEGKEHLGGFTVIQAPDLDAALGWGRKFARAITLPIEVRPLQHGSR
jgi:hypothetical protein